jgi:hypothetical protein
VIPHPFQEKLVIMVKTIDSGWLRNELLDMQRWEDEGGQIIENNAPMPDQLSVPPAPINSGRQARFLQWNERFVIEPSQPRTGIFLTRKKHTTKAE